MINKKRPTKNQRKVFAWSGFDNCSNVEIPVLALITALTLIKCQEQKSPGKKLFLHLYIHHACAAHFLGLDLEAVFEFGDHA